MILHPTFRRLKTFAERGEGPARLRDHLAACSRCRETVAWLREVPERARRGTAVDPPEGFYEEIRKSRSTGARTILPREGVPDPQPTPRVRSALAGGAAVLVILIMGGLTLLTPEAGADRSELSFTPAEPRVGDSIAVEYHRGPSLPVVDRLVLRARFRDADDKPYRTLDHIGVTGLLRGDDGVYRGAFRLPEDAVFAAFAVETEAADAVDGNGGRFWEILVHGADSAPLLEALEQRIADLMGRNWEAAHETARRKVELYPDDPASWSTLFFFGRQLYGEAVSDSLKRAHEPRFRAFHRAFRDSAPLSGELLGNMMWYGRSLELSDEEAHWRGRLLEEAPIHPQAVQERAGEALVAYRDHDDSRRYLSDLNRIYDEAGPVHDNLVILGIRAARMAEDTAAYLEWADRYVEVMEHDIPSRMGIARSIGEMTGRRDEGIRRLEPLIKEIRSEKKRPLGRTAEEHAVKANEGVARALVAMAEIHEAHGETTLALARLEKSARRAWIPQTDLSLARMRIEAGDTTGAIRSLARVAVDPSTEEAVRDSVTTLGRGLGPSHWMAASEEALKTLRDHVMREATLRPIDTDDIDLLTGEGASRSLAEILDGKRSVVVFWSRHCGPALEVMERLEALRERMTRRGETLVLITEEPPSAEFREFLQEKAFDVPVYHDVGREASRAFENWGTPHYYVLDREDRVRFRPWPIEEVARHLAALALLDG